MADNAERTALIAEDEALLAEVVAWALEDAGFKAVVAGSGDEELALYKASAFDLLVTDIRMPGKTDGWLLAHQVRAQSPDLPVIFMSGYSPDSPSLPARSIFLQKPFRP